MLAAAGSWLAEGRQHRLDAVDDVDGVGVGLALHGHDDRAACRRTSSPSSVVLDRVDDAGHLAEPHRMAVAVGDDELGEAGGIVELRVRR